MLYGYLNLTLFEEKWSEKLAIDLFYFSENQTRVELFYKELVNNLHPHLKTINLIYPKDLFNQTKNELSQELFEVFTQEEIEKNFPYVIKIYPKTLDDYFQLVSQLNLLREVIPEMEMESPKLVKFIKSSKVLKIGFLGLIFSWLLVYFIFIMFINLFLNEIFKESLKTLFLLGGTVRSLSGLRTLLFCIFISMGFLLALLSFLLISENLTYFLETVPFLSFLKDLRFFIVFLSYILLSCVLVPWVIIYISYREYEV